MWMIYGHLKYCFNRIYSFSWSSHILTPIPFQNTNKNLSKHNSQRFFLHMSTNHSLEVIGFFKKKKWNRIKGEIQ